MKKYIRLLSRLKTYCEGCNVLTVQGITRDLITGFCKDWPELYPSSITRAKLRERLRSFLRYSYEAQWLERIPPVPKFKIEELEIQPLTPEEYKPLIEAVYVTIEGSRDNDKWQHRVYTFIQTMRWTGLTRAGGTSLNHFSTSLGSGSETVLIHHFYFFVERAVIALDISKVDTDHHLNPRLSALSFRDEVLRRIIYRKQLFLF